MANPYRPETLRRTTATARVQIATLVADLARSMALLTADIEHEEALAGVHDVSAAAYPVLARNLRARRENIEATIASLEAMIHGVPTAA